MRDLGPVARATLPTFVVALLVFGLAAVTLLVMDARADLRAVSDRLGARTAPVMERDPTTVPQARAALAGAGHAEIIGPGGRSLARSGSEAIWTSEPAPVLTRLAARGLAGGTVDGAYEVRVALPSGGTAVLRELRPSAHGDVGGAALAAAAALAIIGATLMAILAALIARRGYVRLERLTRALEAVGVSPRGRLDLDRDGPEWRAASAALAEASARADDFRAVAETRFDVLAAALTPLPVAAAARTPAGSTLRNGALDALLRELNGDARTVEDALTAGLDSRGAVADRLQLSDGRTLDVDSWAVPGGRLVTVADRTEQQRIERLRGRLAGGAMRSLRAPIDEIRVAAAELFRRVPSDGADDLQRILRSSDRLDRLTRALLRGGPHDPASAEVSRRPVGVAGLLWDAAREWDAGLKPRALRVELDIEADLPIADTDPALVEEILGELVENAAKFSRRGATVRVAAGATRDGSVAVVVSDDGEGFTPEEAASATQYFYRGPGADILPGSGLGLGVAAALAERLGGRLDVSPGPGGRVTLTLPAAPVAPPRAAAA